MTITPKIIADAISLAFDHYHAQVVKLAKLVAHQHLVPFCDAHGLQHVSDGRFRDYTHAPGTKGHRFDEEDWQELVGYDELVEFFNTPVPGIGELSGFLPVYPDFEAQEKKAKNLAEQIDEFCEPITGKDMYSQQEIAAAFEVLAQTWRAAANKPVVEAACEEKSFDVSDEKE